jgi:uncharacterized delta-60 repeat protein
VKNSKWIVGATFMAAVAGWRAETASAQVVRDWVAQYPGLRAVAVAADPNGGIYVAGTSLFDAAHNFKTDIVVLKYSLDGNLIWSREFDELDDQTFGTDFASHMVLDPHGNVIVTGGSFINSTGDDFITIKYDPDGNLIWKTRYTPTSVGAVRVGVDAASNVYIIGPSSSVPSGRNYVTIKYNPNGVEQWVRIYNGPNSFDDNPKGLAVTPAGRVAVTGESTGGVTSFDFATIVYDTDGNQLWLQRFNNPEDEGDYGFDVAFGPANEVYVVGLSLGDATLIKYEPAGAFAWVRQYNGPANLGDLFSRVRVDSNGDVVAAGYVQSESLYTDLLVAKYDPQGNLLWDDIYAGPIESDDLANYIAIGPANEIYVTGQSDTGFLTARYESAGNRAWLDVFVPSIFINRGNGVALDAEGNVVAAGEYPILTVHYNQRGGGASDVGDLADSGVGGALAVLEPAAPNPAKSVSTIRFQLKQPAHAKLRVYDVAGKVVATLVDKTLGAGSHEVVFAPKSLSSGVYIYALEAGGERISRRLEWLR